MYSLDVNFLNDRPELKPNSRRSGRSPKIVISSADKRPMYIGLAALIAFPIFAGAVYGILAWRMGDLERQQVALDSQLGNLEIEKKNLASIEAQAKQATDEAQALATVFNQIKPWSAMAQDIRDRLPANVQLLAIKQLESKDGSSAPGGVKVPNAVQIDGFANSFNDVNDFLLTLQQSNFLRPEITKIVDAHLGDDRTLQTPDMPNVPFKRTGAAIKLPKQVQFSIVTAVSEVPASDLIRELDRKGAIGLVTRIEALQDRGVIQTASTQPAASSKGAAVSKQDKGAKP